MPIFTYTGSGSGGREVAGEIEAENLEQAQQILRSRKVASAKVKKKPAAFKIPGLGGDRKVTAGEVTQFSRQFATMIDAGLPLVQCLTILQDQAENPSMSTALKKVTTDVEAGSTLSEAMAKHDKIFNSLFINMVAAGEVGGILDEVLLRISGYMEKADQLKRKIKGAMMYPVVVFTVAMGASAVLLVVVVPTFVGMFEGTGVPLPLPTKIVIAISNFLQAYIIYMGVIGFALFKIYQRYYATDRGEQVLDGIKLKLPVIGDLARKGAVARFCRTLSTLLASGVSILEALDITARTAGNRIVEDALMEARSSIGGGETITAPLEESGVFPKMVMQMVNVGEQTGELDNMLGKIADYYDEEVDAAVDALTSVIEPIIIVYLGVVVGGMVMAMYLPMFDMMKVVG
ncbi:type II secretion system F family protein [Gemmatimonadota bacterium]